jgi:predicted Zn-dependent protease
VRSVVNRSQLLREALRWFLTSGLLVVGCNQEGQGPGKRPQSLALTPQQELQIGREAFQELLSQASVVEDGPELARVRRVGERIAKAALIEPLQREINLHVSEYQFEWEYALIEEMQINAFCMPGGKIGVYTALLQAAENDDELAAVIAHEVAHALAHHTSERIARQRAQGNGLLTLAFDREQESEADHIGVFLMTFAGFDPEQAVEFWMEMMGRYERGIHLPEILSNHPSDSRRIRQLREWVPLARAAKKALEEGRIAPVRHP